MSQLPPELEVLSAKDADIEALKERQKVIVGTAKIIIEDFRTELALANEKIAKLEADVNYYQRQYADEISGLCDKKLFKEKIELEAKLNKAIEALEFYADKSNFTCVDEGRNFMAHYVVYEQNPETYGDDAPGTFARKALREVRGEE